MTALTCATAVLPQDPHSASAGHRVRSNSPSRVMHEGGAARRYLHTIEGGSHSRCARLGATLSPSVRVRAPREEWGGREAREYICRRAPAARLQCFCDSHATEREREREIGPHHTCVLIVTYTGKGCCFFFTVFVDINGK